MSFVFRCHFVDVQGTEAAKNIANDEMASIYSQLIKENAKKVFKLVNKNQ